MMARGAACCSPRDVLYKRKGESVLTNRGLKSSMRHGPVSLSATTWLPDYMPEKTGNAVIFMFTRFGCFSRLDV